MDNIIVFKTTQHVNNRIGLPNIRQELIPKPSPLLAPFANLRYQLSLRLQGWFFLG